MTTASNQVNKIKSSARAMCEIGNSTKSVSRGKKWVIASICSSAAWRSGKESERLLACMEYNIWVLQMKIFERLRANFCIA